jgi:hypothetical protein
MCSPPDTTFLFYAVCLYVCVCLISHSPLLLGSRSIPMWAGTAGVPIFPSRASPCLSTVAGTKILTHELLGGL